jgi:hypothetical protein
MAAQTDIGIPQFGDEVQSIPIGQFEVENDECGGSAQNQPTCMLDCGGLERQVAVGGEIVGEESPREEMILDQEDRHGCAGGHAHQSREP